MARKTTFDDALDYIFIANDKNPNTYVISSATYSATTSASTTSFAHDASNRIINAISGTVALTAATVTATTAAILGNTNSNTFSSDSLISSSASSSADSNMFNGIAIDLGSMLINDSMINDTSLLADIVNGSDLLINGTASSNLTTHEDLGELIRMAATSVVLGLMILITIIGNVFVIAAIILERNLQNVANYLVASLAVADLFVACLVMPLGAVYEISQGWILGPELCDIWTSIDVLCCTASILHLVAIAVDSTYCAFLIHLDTYDGYNIINKHILSCKLGALMDAVDCIHGNIKTDFPSNFSKQEAWDNIFIVKV